MSTARSDPVRVTVVPCTSALPTSWAPDSIDALEPSAWSRPSFSTRSRLRAVPSSRNVARAARCVPEPATIQRTVPDATPNGLLACISAASSAPWNSACDGEGAVAARSMSWTRARASAADVATTRRSVRAVVTNAPGTCQLRRPSNMTSCASGTSAFRHRAASSSDRWTRRTAAKLGSARSHRSPVNISSTTSRGWNPQRASYEWSSTCKSTRTEPTASRSSRRSSSRRRAPSE